MSSIELNGILEKDPNELIEIKVHNIAKTETSNKDDENQSQKEISARLKIPVNLKQKGMSSLELLH